MNTNTALRSATTAGTLIISLVIGGMSLAAPLSAFAYFGAMPNPSNPSFAVCNGSYDPNCLMKTTNYLNVVSSQYAPQGYYYGNSYVTPTNYNRYVPNSYTDYNHNSNYGYNSYSSYNSYNGYNSNSYYAPSYSYQQPTNYNSYQSPNYNYGYNYQYSYSY